MPDLVSRSSRARIFGNGELTRQHALGTFQGMGTVAEIEKAITDLPLRMRRVLLRHLHVQFGQDGKKKTGGTLGAWPVPPPKVSKAESRKVAQRIADEFGRVEPENWR